MACLVFVVRVRSEHDERARPRFLYSIWRDGRVVEGARLLSVCTPKGYRGFESLSLRHFALRHDRFQMVWDLRFEIGVAECARSSIGQSTRLRIWGLGVQIPPGAPIPKIASQYAVAESTLPSPYPGASVLIGH